MLMSVEVPKTNQLVNFIFSDVPEVTSTLPTSGIHVLVLALKNPETLLTYLET